MRRRCGALVALTFVLTFFSGCAGEGGAGARPLDGGGMDPSGTKTPPLAPGDTDAGPPEDGQPVEVAKEQPPPPASNFRARPVAGGIELTWTASADVRYRILRKPVRGPGRQLARVESRRSGAARYLDRTARSGMTYRYWIVPENLWGLRGAASALVTVRAG